MAAWNVFQAAILFVFWLRSIIETIKFQAFTAFKSIISC